MLAANPGLPFVLIGDTGQHDAPIYRDAVRRHADRIERVILRIAGRAPDPKVQKAISQIEEMGVPAHAVASYDDVIGVLAAA